MKNNLKLTGADHRPPTQMTAPWVGRAIASQACPLCLAQLIPVRPTGGNWGEPSRTDWNVGSGRYRQSRCGLFGEVCGTLPRRQTAEPVVPTYPAARRLKAELQTSWRYRTKNHVENAHLVPHSLGDGGFPAGTKLEPSAEYSRFMMMRCGSPHLSLDPSPLPTGSREENGLGRCLSAGWKPRAIVGRPPDFFTSASTYQSKDLTVQQTIPKRVISWWIWGVTVSQGLGRSGKSAGPSPQTDDRTGHPLPACSLRKCLSIKGPQT